MRFTLDRIKLLLYVYLILRFLKHILYLHELWLTPSMISDVFTGVSSKLVLDCCCCSEECLELLFYRSSFCCCVRCLFLLFSLYRLFNYLSVEATQESRKGERMNKKLINVLSAISFNRTCIINNLWPNHTNIFVYIIYIIFNRNMAYIWDICWEKQEILFKIFI